MQDSGGGAGLHARVESKYGPVDLVRITVQDSTVNNNTMGVSRCMHGMLFVFGASYVFLPTCNLK
jgi:hypothetical protein